MGVGERIKTIRGGVLQEEFAKKISISKSSVGRFEREERSPDIEDLNKILTAYPEINPAWLLTGEGQVKKELGNINERIMCAVIEVIEESDIFANLSLPPEDKAKFIVETYKYFLKDKDKENIDKELVKKMIAAFDAVVRLLLEKGVDELTSEELRKASKAILWKEI
jgi:transcriptional regulator with XRE-family HTH domain